MPKPGKPEYEIVTMSDAAARRPHDHEVTLWDRLRTPIRDALRGQWKLRVTVRRTISAAALPATIEGMIERVIRRTRLWKREKLEVARELLAHFADGLEAGRSSDELVKAFGDP